MYQIVWEYEVRSDRIAAFVELYGPTHFVTLDRWTSAAALEDLPPDRARAAARSVRIGGDRRVTPLPWFAGAVVLGLA